VPVADQTLPLGNAVTIDVFITAVHVKHVDGEWWSGADESTVDVVLTLRRPGVSVRSLSGTRQRCRSAIDGPIDQGSVLGVLVVLEPSKPGCPRYRGSMPWMRRGTAPLCDWPGRRQLSDQRRQVRAEQTPTALCGRHLDRPRPRAQLRTGVWNGL
jgi:hypothetical protein